MFSTMVLRIPSLPSSSSSFLSFRPTLTLEAADRIVNAAIKGVKNLAKPVPVTVTVLDNVGSILVQKRMDGCTSAAYQTFSYAKAKTCIHLNTSSRGFREKYTQTGNVAQSTQAMSMVSVMSSNDGSGSGLLPVAGGVLIQSMILDGSTSSGSSSGSSVAVPVGAVGVSGATADEDEYLAILGVQEGLMKAVEQQDDEQKKQQQQYSFTTIPENHSCNTLR